jgi:hypothetical protein
LVSWPEIRFGFGRLFDSPRHRVRFAINPLSRRVCRIFVTTAQCKIGEARDNDQTSADQQSRFVERQDVSILLDDMRGDRGPISSRLLRFLL